MARKTTKKPAAKSTPAKPMKKGSLKKLSGAGTKSGAQITQDVTVNKAKTADKAFNAMDAYIRG